MEEISPELQAVLDGQERRFEPDRRMTNRSGYVAVERRHDTRDRRGGWSGTLKSFARFIAAMSPNRRKP